MAMMPQGYAPAVPGLTAGEGVAPSAMDPLQIVAMMMGKNPDSTSTADKMAQVVQLLREVSKEDPRIALLASDALRLLIEGPTTGATAAPGPVSGSPQAPGAPGGMIA